MYCDSEINNAFDEIDTEFDSIRPKRPEAPIPPNLDFNFDILKGVEIVSKHFGTGYVTEVNMGKLLQAIVVVKYKDHNGNILLTNLKENDDLTIDQHDLPKVKQALEKWNREIQSLLDYWEKRQNYLTESEDFSTKQKTWETEKQKRKEKAVESIHEERNRIRKKELEEKRAKVPKFDIAKHILYVYRGRGIKCKRYNHDVISVTCIIKDISNNDVEINAEYCFNCGIFIISVKSYMDYALKYNINTIYFRPISSIHTDEIYYDANSCSALQSLRYNVSAGKNYSEEYRHKLLELFISLGLLKKHQVISHLEHLVVFNGEKWGNEIAQKKWENDLEFVRNLDIDVQQHVRIDEIRNY